MLRYAVLRILVFLAALALLWLLGLRGEENLLLLVVGAALLSAVVSFVALRRFREDTSAQIAARLDHRSRSRSARVADSGADEQVEDAEVEQRRAAAAQAEDRADDDGDFR
jgi:Protein of unknown function (DUF4229)